MRNPYLRYVVQLDTMNQTDCDWEVDDGMPSATPSATPSVTPSVTTSVSQVVADIGDVWDLDGTSTGANSISSRDVVIDFGHVDVDLDTIACAHVPTKTQVKTQIAKAKPQTKVKQNVEKQPVKPAKGKTSPQRAQLKRPPKGNDYYEYDDHEYDEYDDEY